MNETTWKKTFVKQKEDPDPSDPNPDDSVYDDILKMQQKLKNINRRREAMKNAGYKENYKNIELFQSIYQKMYDESDNEDEDDDDNDHDDDKIRDINDIHDSDSDDDNIGNTMGANTEGFSSKKKKKKTRINPANVAPIPSTTSTTTNIASNAANVPPPKKEIRNFNDLKNAFLNGITTLSEGINNFLFFFPNYVDKKLTSKTTQFSKIFSEQNASPSNVKKDSNIIKQFIYQLVSFVIAIWVAINWFFIMVYKSSGVKGCTEEDNRCYVTNDNDRFKVNFKGLGQLTSLFEYYLDFTIMPLWTFDEYVLGDKYGKKVFNYIPWKIISHFIILWLSFNIVYNFDFFTMIKQSISGITLLNIYSGITIGSLYLYKLYNTFKSKILNDTDLKMGLNAEVIDKLKNAATQMSSPLTWLFIQFVTFVILLGIAVLSINIGSIILVLFVWFMSLFAIPYYKGFSDTWNTVFNIYEYIKEDFDNNDEQIKDIGIFNKILRGIAKILYKNTYYIGFIILLLFQLFKMNMFLSSVQLKQVMSVIIVPMIGIIGSFIWENASTQNGSSPVHGGVNPPATTGINKEGVMGPEIKDMGEDGLNIDDIHIDNIPMNQT